MKTLIVSTAYLPPASIFSQMLHHDEIYVENHGSYHRQTLSNRCHVYGPGGILKLSVPVIKPSKKNREISGIVIDNTTAWQRDHWRALLTCYSRSPYFLHYRDGFEHHFMEEQHLLVDWNLKLIRVCMDLLHCNNNILLTESYTRLYPDANDLRDYVNKKSPVGMIGFPRYPQVFEEKYGFIPDLSIADLLFNRGPDAAEYLKKIFLNFTSGTRS